MQNALFRKGVVVEIIVLFIGASILPCISGYDLTQKGTNGDIVWSWAKSAGGTSSDFGIGCTLNSNGNIYVTGFFSGTATFGTSTLSSQGAEDVFVAKLDTNGGWQWAKCAGGTGSDKGAGIAVDPNGNIYVTGFFSGTATFGTTTLTSQGAEDVFVAKLDTNGGWQWVKCAGGTGSDEGNGVSVGPGGNIYVTGYFSGPATFGSITLMGDVVHFSRDIFIAKISNTVDWQWAKCNHYDMGPDEGLGIAVNANGDTYTTAFMTDTIGGDYDYLLLIKLNTNGDEQWTKWIAEWSGGGHWRGVVLDSSSNPYITGFYNGTITVDGTTLTSKGADDVLVAKLSANGGWQWVISAGGPRDDEGVGVAVDSNGEIYLTGYFSSTATFGTITLTSHGAMDVFVAKLDTNGDWQWAKSAGGTSGDDSGQGVAVDSSGNIYVNGYFSGTATFGSITLTSQGNEDVFIAKLSTDNPPSPPTIDGPISSKARIAHQWNFTSIDPNGDNISYYVDWGDGTTYNWSLSYHSGEAMAQSHLYDKGTFTIKAKAKDIYGHESDWGTLQITMPLAYGPQHHPFFSWLLERFPYAFPILRHLLGY